ncbi:MAG: hydrogenase [Saprospiraceae bacterium]|nr:hydrogenase [Saprospiraceae bacterium]
MAFIFLGIKTNSFDFKDFTIYAASAPVQVTIGLFICFFIGFSIKAGFFPFHTWLPYAHPAAPSHVSGVMSGVIIKIGIYGILRMILVIKTDYVVIGYSILFIYVIYGVYGFMLAILQHNLKKLLAYHSIENIGIIGIGIGIGCIGIGTGKDILIILGFAGALLHTLNHSLFKSLLFYGAGNVYQATHTMNIEQLGGLTKRMPHTSLLFLISALAICGLPPFNGFISEFLIYSGMFAGLQQLDLFLLTALVFSMFALVLIGGLALMCFTKAYGAVFLGTPRIAEKHIPEEAGWGKLLPMYSILILMVSIGIFPNLFMEIVAVPVGLFSVSTTLTTSIVPLYETLIHISYGALIFLVLVAILYFIRTLILSKNEFITGPTWGCGYIAPTIKMQYTASSFIRAYRKLAEPILSIHKKKKEISGIFPTGGRQETHPYDQAEELMIDYPIGQFKHFLNKFAFLQNGNPKFYILYGVTFILLVLAFPSILNIIISILNFLNQ